MLPFLTLCVVTSYMESLGQCSSCCGPCFRSGDHPCFWDHLAFGGCWPEGPLPSWEDLLLAGGRGCTTGFDGSSTIHTCPTFHDWCWVPAVEEWHSLYRAAHGWFGLHWVQRDSSHALPLCKGMYSFLFTFLSLLLHFPTHGDTQLWWLCQGVASPIRGGPIDPPHLPWLVYAYGPNGFAHEHHVGWNPNVIGYLFPDGAQAVSSLSPLSCLFFSCISQHLF